MWNVAEHEQVERLHARFDDLWRYAEWRCVYVPKIDRPVGILTLYMGYMGSAVVVQIEPQHVDEMLRVSSWWREVVASPWEGGALPGLELVPMPDRRQFVADRRWSHRGGRRAGEAR